MGLLRLFQPTKTIQQVTQVGLVITSTVVDEQLPSPINNFFGMDYFSARTPSIAGFGSRRVNHFLHQWKTVSV